MMSTKSSSKPYNIVWLFKIRWILVRSSSSLIYISFFLSLIGNYYYLLEPPNDDWRRQALAKSRLILGNIMFPVAPFDPEKFEK
jgi:hypothetical protein